MAHAANVFDLELDEKNVSDDEILDYDQVLDNALVTSCYLDPILLRMLFVFVWIS